MRRPGSLQRFMLPASAALAACQAGAQPCTPHWSTEFGVANGLSAPSHALLAGRDGELYVGGSFTQAGPVAAARIAQYGPAGWTALGVGINAQNGSGWGGSFVECLAAFDDGAGPRVIAGGYFSSSGSMQVAGVARWDGAEWGDIGGGVWLTGCFDCIASVADMVVHDDGSGPALFVGGVFNRLQHSGGTPACGIGRWNASGWSNLGLECVQPPLPPADVRALAVFDDGAGAMLYANGYVGNSGPLARWNGASWSSVPGGRHAFDMTVFDDGAGPALYLAEFYSPGGTALLGRVARWDGMKWSVAGSDFSAPIYALAAFDDGTGEALYAGGAFELAGVKGLARWREGAWQAVGGGIGLPSGGQVRDLAVMPGAGAQSLLVAGTFTAVGSAIPSGHIARWVGCPATCYPDCDASGVLTIQDFGCFQAKFVGGDPYADCTQSNGLTIADFACFQSKFVAGCP